MKCYNVANVQFWNDFSILFSNSIKSIFMSYFGKSLFFVYDFKIEWKWNTGGRFFIIIIGLSLFTSATAWKTKWIESLTILKYSQLHHQWVQWIAIWNLENQLFQLNIIQPWKIHKIIYSKKKSMWLTMTKLTESSFLTHCIIGKNEIWIYFKKKAHLVVVKPHRELFWFFFFF